MLLDLGRSGRKAEAGDGSPRIKHGYVLTPGRYAGAAAQEAGNARFEPEPRRIIAVV